MSFYIMLQFAARSVPNVNGEDMMHMEHSDYITTGGLPSPPPPPPIPVSPGTPQYNHPLNQKTLLHAMSSPATLRRHVAKTYDSQRNVLPDLSEYSHSPYHLHQQQQQHPNMPQVQSHLTTSQSINTNMADYGSGTPSPPNSSSGYSGSSHRQNSGSPYSIQQYAQGGGGGHGGLPPPPPHTAPPPPPTSDYEEDAPQK